jgi:hypothetical protein
MMTFAFYRGTFRKRGNSLFRHLWRSLVAAGAGAVLISKRTPHGGGAARNFFFGKSIH